MHWQICPYNINKVWKYLVSYHNKTVVVMKDERESDITNFLSKIKNRYYSCERLIPVHSSWRGRIGYVASVPDLRGQTQEHKIVLMKRGEILNLLPFLMTWQFSCCWMIFQNLYSLTARPPAHVTCRCPTSFRLCHLCEYICVHVRTCRPWTCRKSR